MAFALAAVSIYAVAMTLLWRSSARSVSKLFERWARANGQFVACDADMNATKVKYAQALMQIEDLKKDR